MIHIITTGGTIEGLDYEQEKNRTQKVTSSIKDFLASANVTFEYSLEEVFSKDSRFITLEDRQAIAEIIKSSKSDKILISHGTITMVETAEFLGGLKLGKTIVLVGSFILGTNEKTDAPFNLGYALGVLQNQEKGVYITMNGKVFFYDNVVKNVRENRFERKS